MKSSEPLISSAFRSYEAGFMDPIVPQSKMYSLTDAGVAARFCAVSDAAISMTAVPTAIQNDSLLFRMG